MTAKAELRDFLVTRRGRLTPDRAGLPVYGANRRVSGLRREEVALLSGISVEYYTRLERGTVGEVSPEVLDGVAHALQLDEAERDHLVHLARALGPGSRRTARRPTTAQVRPTLQRVLDQLGGPAYVRNGRFDVLAANATGRALYAPVYEQAADDGRERPNTARFVFLSPVAGDFFVDHAQVRDDAVAFLRAEAGRDPYDRALSDLVGELSTLSDDFRELWARHDVRYHRTGTKRLRHPLVGPLTLDFEGFELADGSGHRLNVYSAQPGSADAEALGLLASWQGTPDPVER